MFATENPNAHSAVEKSNVVEAILKNLFYFWIFTYISNKRPSCNLASVIRPITSILFSWVKEGYDESRSFVRAHSKTGNLITSGFNVATSSSVNVLAVVLMQILNGFGNVNE